MDSVYSVDIAYSVDSVYNIDSVESDIFSVKLSWHSIISRKCDNEEKIPIFAISHFITHKPEENLIQKFDIPINNTNFSLPFKSCSTVTYCWQTLANAVLLATIIISNVACHHHHIKKSPYIKKYQFLPDISLLLHVTQQC